MSRLQERENMALSSLHDISDYSSYIDQRISKLNNLYQSLTISPERRLHSKKQQQPTRPPSLTRQPPNQMLNYLVNRTLQGREKWLGKSPDQMYHTEYFPRKERYNLSDQKSQIYAQLKSLTHSNLRNSLDASRSKLTKQEEKKPVNKKLEMYKQIKDDILGTFYIGGRTLSNNQTNTAHSKATKEQIFVEQAGRTRRGRLWHGRPPVKIIEKYE